MGLFKGLKTSKERKKAKEFYSEVPKMNTQPRELRKLKAVLGARLTAFIDKTFIEGAESISEWQEKGSQGRPPATFSSAYKDVKTIGHIYDQSALLIELQKHIENLPERTKLIISLYYTEEMNLKEIAAILEISESRVSQILSETAGKLKTRLTLN